MKIATVEIGHGIGESLDRLAAGFLKAVERGEEQGKLLRFGSPEMFLDYLTPNRLAILRVIRGGGEFSMREIARRVKRDIRRVHGDVHALLDLGLAEKTASGRISCPFEEIRIRANIDLKLAA